jgi:hypothetical protein
MDVANEQKNNPSFLYRGLEKNMPKPRDSTGQNMHSAIFKCSRLPLPLSRTVQMIFPSKSSYIGRNGTES